MACACNKNRRQTPAYSRMVPAAPATDASPAEPEIEPSTLRLPSGEERTYGSRLEAHAARIRYGGELVATP